MSNVRDFGTAGDGATDDADAIVHALRQGDGTLQFPPGTYRLSKTIPVPLDAGRRFGVEGTGGAAKIVMAGAGPAFHVAGTHDKNAKPDSFRPGVWQRERMPSFLNIEIEGANPAADGVLLEGTMQATFEGLLLRKLRHGIHVRGRNRNLLVSHCHVYDNRGVGIFLDAVNLHQAIVTGSHVSYCLGGGVGIQRSEIRNLQITGNDIEYNHDVNAASSADVWIDSSADGSSVREGTIVGNTIQALPSPGGANVRIVGLNPTVNHKAGIFTISDNHVASQEINVHLVACRGIVVSGNVIYGGHRRNVLVEGSRNLVFGPANFDHNPDYGPNELCSGLRFVDSRDLIVNGVQVHDCQAGRHTVAGATPIERQGLMEFVRCRRVVLTGCEILDPHPAGLYLEDCSDVNASGCLVVDSREPALAEAGIRWKGRGVGNMLTGTRFSGAAKALEIDPDADVMLADNRT